MHPLECSLELGMFYDKLVAKVDIAEEGARFA